MYFSFYFQNSNGSGTGIRGGPVAGGVGMGFYVYFNVAVDLCL